MDKQSQNTIKRAVRLIKSGKFAEARPILVGALKRDENLAEAWFLLSYTLPKGDRQEYALIQALRIDPQFEKARQRLELLTGKAYTSALPAAKAPEEKAWTEDAEALASLDPEPLPQTTQESALPAGWAEDLTVPTRGPSFVEEAEPATETEMQGRGGRGRLILVLILIFILAAFVFVYRDDLGALLVFPGRQPTATQPAGFRELPPTWTPSPDPGAAVATAEP